MFDLLIQTILEFIGLFKFWVVVNPYEKAVRIRLGTGVTVFEPGFHWHLPFGIDHLISEHITPTTHSLGDESMITKDGKSCGFHAVVTYQVNDIVKCTLKVSDADHAVRESCAGEIGRVLRESTWSEIIGEEGDILDKLTKACRARGWKWGIEILSVQLAGLSLVRNIRLMGRTN